MITRLLAISCLFGLLVAASFAHAEEPPLPAGLGPPPAQTQSSEPALPAGLGGPSEPALPEGLGDGGTDSAGGWTSGEEYDFADEDGGMPFGLTGFIEARGGMRIIDQPHEKDASIGETRLQVQAEKYAGDFSFRLTTDLLFDPVADRYEIDLDEGDGWIDLREAFVSWRATSFMDLKAGRQILTWGTGDLVFLNDLFPKDFDSFFIGRDEEYLKAPSDAVKASFFSDFANIDIVYTPNFDADRFADGARISVFNPFLGRVAGRRNILDTDPRGKWFDEDEWAARLYRNIGAYETALYGYYGYWKNPQGLEPARMRATFPPLAVYGASIRGPFGRGIGNMEVAYYDSRDDRGGGNPFLPNDQFRFLAGYEQEIMTELTAGLQYNLEHTLDHDALVRNAPPGSPILDEFRHLLTLRLTKLLMNQNLTLSLFNFWSPSDQDGYIRPRVTYKVTDNWTTEAGMNIFWGDERYTFFGQPEDNSNVYVSLRYSY